MGYNNKIKKETMIALCGYGMPMKHKRLFKAEPECPTYGEVFDWFAGRHKIVITMTPWPTFALLCRAAYTYTISVYNEENAKFDRIEDTEMGSFDLEAEDAINKAIEIIKER